MCTDTYIRLYNDVREYAGRAACLRRSLTDYGRPDHQRWLREQLRVAEDRCDDLAQRLLAYVPHLDDAQFASLVSDLRTFDALCGVALPGTPAYARLEAAIF